MAQNGKRTGIWIWMAVAAAVVLGVLWYVRGSREDVPIATATVTQSDLSVQVSTNGRVEPVEDYQAHAPAPGDVERVKVQVGQHVQAGQELLSLDASDARNRLATAQAQLSSSELALQNMRNGGSTDEMLAERNDLQTAKDQQVRADQALSTLKQLQEKGSASANEVASAQQRATDAREKVVQLQTRMKGRYSGAELTTQQAQITQARSAVSAAQSAIGGVVLRAPFAGTVYSLPVAQYDFVAAGEALINIADLNRLQVRAYFDEPEIGKLAPGQPVTFKWEAKPNRIWHGHVTQIPTTIVTQATRNVGECLISVDDANGDLTPNTNVTVTVTTHSQHGIMTLPHEALRTIGSDTFVYKVVNGRLVKTTITLGDYNPTRIQVLGGLSMGDVVALNAQAPSTELHDGMRVVTASR